MHAYRVHPAHRYRSEQQEPYPSSRVEAAPFPRASNARALPSPSAPVRAAPPVDALLPREAASLPARVPPPRAALHPMCGPNEYVLTQKKERKGDNPAYRLGAHPSLVEYEPRDLIGLG